MTRRTPGIGSSTLPGARSRSLSKGMSSLMYVGPIGGNDLPLFQPHLHPSCSRMADVLHALIPALWILWLAYWVVAAPATHETRRREGFRSRLSHYGPLIVGGLCL